MKKIFSVLLSLVMLMSLLSVGVAVSAATPDSQVIEAAAGETIKIKFSEDNCYGVSGNIEYSNRNLFSSLTAGGSTFLGKITDEAFILSSADKVTCDVILTVKVAADAKVGDTCVVSFTGCELVENNEDFSGRSDYTKTVTVKVVKKETPTTKPTTPTTKPTTPTTKPTKPTKPTSKPTQDEPVEPTQPTDAPTTEPTTAPTEPPVEPDEDDKIIQNVEVKGECDERCHIWKDANPIWHPLVIILLIISVLLNIGLGVLILLYFLKRKKNATDNTPVVDYDINDD